ncbi:unnamed protein product [Periconia digitata]|uniref:Uncharacterized protein n=1 Tax=Periconia digitata TaxID=1303443 RepID=A0A9W4XWP7_9PLEO|nr:unnamed protein product [Periconia digitata]
MSAMATETLVTFLFECPARARTIELLGSWDNFTKPYHLQRDRRRGHGIWSGCYTFQDIICDGDLDNLGQKRTGALKMGGTYWYYYKVDDEESHNPSEPTTTSCPLLPGQKLNVLEVPLEARSRSSSEESGAFTRNPQDKFLTPVPPKPMPSPRLGDFCKEKYSVPMQNYGPPRSATLPPTSHPSPANLKQHARSASTSPSMSSTAVFSDFKGLKEKLTQKKAAHARSSSARDLEIGAPTLISTTAEEMNLIPLAALQPLPTSPYSIESEASSSFVTPATANLRAFSPLRSHPVKDVEIASVTRPRSRSYTAEATTQQILLKPILNRVQSAETQRPAVSHNEPWTDSPKPSYLQNNDTSPGFMLAPAPAPPLQRPSIPSTISARPTSSHGGNRSSTLRKAPLDKDKKLPPLPRFLVPAPLFACNEALSPKPSLHSESEVEEKPQSSEPEEQTQHVHDSPTPPTDWNSHFSLWSSDSLSSGSPTVDDDAVNSPTLSALTSEFSDWESPKKLSGRFSGDSFTTSPGRKAAAVYQHDGDLDAEPPASDVIPAPKLDSIRLSSFEPGLFLDIQYEESGPRRQAACFGFGFQGYKLPEDETNSKGTLTQSSLQSGPQIQHNRGSSASGFAKLMDEFGFLGESVV